MLRLYRHPIFTTNSLTPTVLGFNVVTAEAVKTEDLSGKLLTTTNQVNDEVAANLFTLIKEQKAVSYQMRGVK